MDTVDLSQLENKLIVSSQAEEGFPLNTPEHLTALAQTAVMGGASAIRASLPENIRAMKEVLEVPVIGIYKNDYPGFDVRITPTMMEIEAIVEAGSDIIALDATDRPRPDGKSFAELYHEIRDRYDVPIMADISNFEEGVAAAELGVDIVATTLSGYTHTDEKVTGPDIALIRDLAAAIDVPIIAEGRIGTPEDVRAALDACAFAVVVGSAITRPHLITENFVAGTQSPQTAEMILALDVGGTKIAAALVGPNGQVLYEEKVPTPRQKGGKAVLHAASDLLEKLSAHQDGASVDAVGISAGGQIDARGQIIGGTEMLPDWVGFPLQGLIAARSQLPTYVLNDGHAAALAEAHYGAGQGRSSMLCVVIGTGLGGGLVIGGSVQHGANGLAGSVGQMKVSPDGRTFIPLEDIVSGPGLLLSYNERVGSAEQADTGKEVALRAQAGDETAAETIRDMGWWLGLGLSHALHAYDAQCVVVGGSVAKIGEPLFESARQSLAQHGHMTVAETPILAAELGSQAQLVGAAEHARQQME